MSYDLILRSDERHTDAIEPAPVREAIAAVLDVDGHGQLHWQAGNDYVQFDLSQVNADGDAIARPELAGRINAIHCHMPVGTYGVTWDVRERATRAALAAARVCGWRIYDPQLDQFLDDFQHRWRAESAPRADAIRRVRLSPDGRHIAFVSTTLRVLATESGENKNVRSVDLAVGDAHWTAPDRLAVCTGGYGGDEHGVITQVELDGQPRGPGAPAPWIDTFAHLGEDLFMLADGHVANASSGAVTRPIESDTGVVELNPEGTLVALRSGVFDPETGAQVLDYEVVDAKMNVAAATWSPSGAMLATGGYDRRTVLWDMSAKTPRPAHTIKRCGQIQDLCFSPDGAFLVTVSDTAVVRVWSTSTGKPAGSLKPPGAFTIWNDYTRRLAPKARVSGRRTLYVGFFGQARLVTTHNDGRVCVWDFNARTLVAEIAFGPTGEWLVVTGDAHDYGGGLEELRLGWITDAAYYAECFTRETLPGTRAPGLLSRVLSQLQR